MSCGARIIREVGTGRLVHERGRLRRKSRDIQLERFLLEHESLQKSLSLSTHHDDADARVSTFIASSNEGH